MIKSIRSVQNLKLSLLGLCLGLIFVQSASGYDVTAQYNGGTFGSTVEASEACEAAVPGDNECKPHTHGVSAYIWIVIDDVGTPSYRALPCSTYSHPGARIPDYCEEHLYYYEPSNCLEGVCQKQKQAGESCPLLTDNPINIATGNKFFRDVEYVGQGVNPLRFTRYYNSTTTKDVWTFSYRQNLEISTTEIQSNREDGKAIIFELTDGVISLSPLYSMQLKQLANGYQLTLPSNTIENYDVNGRLLSIHFSDGQVHNLSYAATSVEIRNHAELMTLHLFDSDPNALVTSIELPDSTLINYTYENVGSTNRLLAVEYPDSRSKGYLYEEGRFPSFVTGIIDENENRISSVQYDTFGRAIISERGDPGSGIERTQIQYFQDGSRTLTNALDKQATYHLIFTNGEYRVSQVEGHASTNCAAANKNYTYYPNGLLETKTDWQGSTTSYQYNTRNLESSRTEAVGTPQERTITTEWHSIFNLRTKITEPGKETIFTYDGQGRLLSQSSNEFPLN